MASRENLTIQEKLRRLTAASCIALGALGLAGCASNANAAPADKDKAPVVLADPLAGESDTTQSEAETAYDDPVAKYIDMLPSSEELQDKYRIPAGLSDEELGKVITERLTNWMNEGITPQLNDMITDEIDRQVAIDPEVDRDEVARQAITRVSDSARNDIFRSMFTPTPHGSLTTTMEDFQSLNSYFIEAHSKTTTNDPRNKGVFGVREEFRSAEKVTYMGHGEKRGIRIYSDMILENIPEYMQQNNWVEYNPHVFNIMLADDGDGHLLMHEFTLAIDEERLQQ